MQRRPVNYAVGAREDATRPKCGHKKGLAKLSFRFGHRASPGFKPWVSTFYITTSWRWGANMQLYTRALFVHNRSSVASQRADRNQQLLSHSSPVPHCSRLEPMSTPNINPLTLMQSSCSQGWQAVNKHLYPCHITSPLSAMRQVMLPSWRPRERCAHPSGAMSSSELIGCYAPIKSVRNVERRLRRIASLTSASCLLRLTTGTSCASTASHPRSSWAEASRAVRSLCS